MAKLVETIPNFSCSKEKDEAAYNALVNAMECDKYDVLPNAKGKVKPNFHEKNLQRLNPLRIDIINAGVEAANNQDNVLGYKYFMYTTISK